MKQLRTIKLLLATWKARLVEIFRPLQKYFQQHTCPHSFRAALVEDKPSRICRICELCEQLSPEEFYAQFGEKYQAAIGARLRKS